MGRAEGIVHVHIAELGERGTEGIDVSLAGLGLLAVYHTFALLLQVEAEVLQQDHATCALQEGE